MTVPGFANPLLMYGDAGGYQIERSLRFNSSDSAYCSRTPASAGNRKKFTYSTWTKLSALGTLQAFFSARSDDNNRTTFLYQDSQFKFQNIISGSAVTVNTSAVFRDPSAWYHILLAVDTDQGTSSNRVRLYVNGVEQTLSGSYPGAGDNTQVNNTVAHAIGRIEYQSPSPTGYFDGYMADVVFIDGQQLTPSSLVETSATTGQLIPKAYTGSYGTNGFQLKFADNSSNTATTLGKDTSGNGNNWTPNNFSVTAGAGNDSLVDTPTSYGTDDGLGGSVRGNYAVFNALALNGNTLSNGNLDYLAGSANKPTLTTVGIPNTGKWYFEFTDVNSTGSFTAGVGTASVGVSSYLGADANGWGYQTHPTNAGYHNSGVFTTTGRINGAGSNTIVGVAIDRDAQKIWFSVNGTYVNSGAPASGANAQYSNLPTSGELFPGASTGSGQNIVFNAGSRAFAYTAPSGFKALCDTNLPAPVVAKGSSAMDVKLYTGNGGTQSITGLGFSPDLVWIKARSAAYSHLLADSVRGPLYTLQSDGPSSEQSYGCVNSFDSTGFTVDMDGSIGANNNGTTFAAWCWDAGTSTVTNTQGSITSQVRANQSAGFSVVSVPGYTYPTKTAGHGLGVEPHFIITKNRGASNPWIIYHKATGANTYFQFDTGSGYTGMPGVWSGVSSTVFPINSGVNQQTDIIAYCFAPVTGYSSMGSYVGNGSSDGPAVWLGFRPKWLLIKRTDSANDWYLQDSARDPYNPCPAGLFPTLSAAEDSSYRSAYPNDMLSNGFKLRTSNAGWNASGGTYLYIAFAESPFQYARAR